MLGMLVQMTSVSNRGLVTGTRLHQKQGDAVFLAAFFFWLGLEDVLGAS